MTAEEQAEQAAYSRGYDKGVAATQPDGSQGPRVWKADEVRYALQLSGFTSGQADYVMQMLDRIRS